jgi:acetyltransferase-like isoleucine patch superfamily enzyme
MGKPHLQSRILGQIDAETVTIGHGVVVEEGAVIAGKGGPAGHVHLGNFSYVGRGVRIMAPEFCLGDYSKLHAGSFGHGVHPLRIGRNCWIGGNTVLDAMGGLDIADNVGIGAQSQLWSHIQFGDVIEGCRFHSQQYLHVQEDAWLVGRCILSPVVVGRRSMALAGSVITKDMEENHVYAGVPAKDITAKVGPQFEERTLEQKAKALEKVLRGFEDQHPQHSGRVRILEDAGTVEEGVTYIDLTNRSYTQTLSDAEVDFFKAHVPLLKFVPKSAPLFFEPGAPEKL